MLTYCYLSTTTLTTAFTKILTGSTHFRPRRIPLFLSCAKYVIFRNKMLSFVLPRDSNYINKYQNSFKSSTFEAYSTQTNNNQIFLPYIISIRIKQYKVSTSQEYSESDCYNLDTGVRQKAFVTTCRLRARRDCAVSRNAYWTRNVTKAVSH